LEYKKLARFIIVELSNMNYSKIDPEILNFVSEQYTPDPNCVDEVMPHEARRLLAHQEYLQSVAKERSKRSSSTVLPQQAEELVVSLTDRKQKSKWDTLIHQGLIAATILAVVFFAAYKYREMRLKLHEHGEIVNNQPTSNGPNSSISVKKDKNKTDRLPSFSEALARLKSKIKGEFDENDALREYNQLLKNYPSLRNEIISDKDLSDDLGIGEKGPQFRVDVQQGFPDTERQIPAPTLNTEELLAQIDKWKNKPIPVHEAQIQQLREQAVSRRNSYPASEHAVIDKFIKASERTPDNEIRYAEAQAAELKDAPVTDVQVQALRGLIASLRLREVTRAKTLNSSALIAFWNSTRPTDGIASKEELKASAVALMDLMSQDGKDGPYLFTVLPSSMQSEAITLRNAIFSAVNSTSSTLDASVVKFLMGVRRSDAADTMGVIVPSHDPIQFDINTPQGAQNWDILIRHGNEGVPITAMVNVVLNREVLGIQVPLRDENITNLIDRAKSAGIQMLAFLDCTPGRKTVNSLIEEIDRWIGLYGKLDGFFIYNSNDGNFLEIYRHIRSKYRTNPMIVYGATTFPAEAVLVEARQDQRFNVCIQSRQPVQVFIPPPWVVKYPLSRFSGVFSAGIFDEKTSVELAASKHLNSVYFQLTAQPTLQNLTVTLAAVRRLNRQILNGANSQQ
jgi:hypothetical protein